MKTILLSGGSGKRLWPLSNDSRAKQFLKVLKNKQGRHESMIQRVWTQLSHYQNKSEVLITTSQSQVEILKRQISDDVTIIVEPERRDTFPAIALACSYLFSEMQISEEEIISVVSVDSFVNENFYKKIFKLEELIEETGAQIAMIGVKPTYPSSKYGYLIPKGFDSYLNVTKFIEKPSEERASKLIESGAYWNSGVFAFPLKLVLEDLIKKGLPVNYNQLKREFFKLPKKSFDYEIVEQLTNIVALKYEGYWKDLGTWNTLSEEMSQNITGMGELSDDSVNTHIINELNLPIKVLGISNAVIAACPDGILVTEKSASSRMKEFEFVNMLDQPMYKEYTWGWYKVLDHSRKLVNEISTIHIHIDRGYSLKYNIHEFHDKSWTIISGVGEVVINEKKKIVKPGDVFKIPRCSEYRVSALEDLEIIEVQIGEKVKSDGAFGIKSIELGGEDKEHYKITI
ncbi:mannose-1-phosphate guanylyltransferase [Heyndrickxia sporothermodurans]|nr:mannose-1-phosphate guanylyltransferase [Heyndrickxia sporothermodurans]